jgi:hypothetical protein
MNWDRLHDLVDNPIFIKHVRSRLRAQHLGAASTVVLLLCICIAWGGYQLEGFANGGAFGVLLGLQALILVVMGASQVGSSVGAARASGILDFHRVSPLTPTELTIGFFFGAPIREYILFCCTLPFSVLCLAFGTPSVHGFVQLMILLIASAWVFHGLALLNALLGKARANPRGVVGLVIFVVFFGSNLIVGVSRSAALVDSDARLQFYGISLPWLTVVLLHMAVVLYFTYLTTRRKMGSERAHPLSKAQSIGALVAASALLVGTIWRREDYGVLGLVTLYLLVVTAMLLTLMFTPNRAEYDKGLWRARKKRLAHLPWWEDLSLNRVFLVIACSIVLVTANLATSVSAERSAFAFPPSPISGSFPLAVAAGVLVSAYFGLAHQYFALRFGERSKTYFALFFFLAWIVPIVAGTILMMASMSRTSDTEKTSAVLFSLSPAAGVGAIAVLAPAESYSTAVRAAAITPALLFTFVFNSLLISARRRAYKEFLAVAEATGMPVSGARAASNDSDFGRPIDVNSELESVG